MKSSPLTVDHIIPRSVWAVMATVSGITYDVDDAQNLAAACWPRNINKGAALQALDPRTRQLAKVFRPRQAGP